MEKNDINHPRFVRSIRWALETLAQEAHCYGWRDDPDYLELKEYLEKQMERLQEDNHGKENRQSL